MKTSTKADTLRMIGVIRAGGGILTAIASAFVLSFLAKKFPESGWIALPLMIGLVVLSGLSVIFIEWWLSSRSGKQ